MKYLTQSQVDVFIVECLGVINSPFKNYVEPLSQSHCAIKPPKCGAPIFLAGSLTVTVSIHLILFCYYVCAQRHLKIKMIARIIQGKWLMVPVSSKNKFSLMSLLAKVYHLMFTSMSFKIPTRLNKSTKRSKFIFTLKLNFTIGLAIQKQLNNRTATLARGDILLP